LRKHQKQSTGWAIKFFKQTFKSDIKIFIIISMFLTTNHFSILISIIFVCLGSPIHAQGLSLEQCIEKALENNKNLKTAKLDQDFAQKQKESARPYIYPQIELRGDYQYNIQLPTQLIPAAAFGGPKDSYSASQFGVPHNLGTDLLINQVLYNQQLFSAFKLVNSGVEIAQIQMKKAEEDVVYNVSATFYAAQILAKQIEFIDKNVNNLEKLIQTTDLLQKNRLAKSTDVDRLVLNKDNLKVQKSTVQSQYDQTLHTLQLLMGMSQNEDISLATDTQEVEIFDTDSTLTIDPQQRTDYQLLQKREEFLRLERQNTKEGLYPTLNAVFQGGYDGFSNVQNKFLGFYNYSFVALRLVVPVFDGGMKVNKMQQKAIEIQKINAQKELLKDNIELELYKAVSQLENAQISIENQKENIALAEKIYNQIQLQFREGQASINDILQSENEINQSQNNYLASLIKYKQAILEIQKASGNLLNK
jgi:outer membrane protein TolC